MTTQQTTEPLATTECAQLLNQVIHSHAAAKAPLAETFASVEKKRLVRSGTKILVQVVDDPLTGRLQSKNLRPSKFGSKEWQMQPAAGVLRRLVELDPDMYLRLTDDEVWQVAARAATDAGLTGNTLRVLSRCVFGLLAVRCGLGTPTAFETV